MREGQTWARGERKIAANCVRGEGQTWVRGERERGNNLCEGSWTNLCQGGEGERDKFV